MRPPEGWAAAPTRPVRRAISPPRTWFTCWTVWAWRRECRCPGWSLRRASSVRSWITRSPRVTRRQPGRPRSSREARLFQDLSHRRLADLGNAAQALVVLPDRPVDVRAEEA